MCVFFTGFSLEKLCTDSKSLASRPKTDVGRETFQVSYSMNSPPPVSLKLNTNRKNIASTRRMKFRRFWVKELSFVIQKMFQPEKKVQSLSSSHAWPSSPARRSDVFRNGWCRLNHAARGICIYKDICIYICFFRYIYTLQHMGEQRPPHSVVPGHRRLASPRRADFFPVS